MIRPSLLILSALLAQTSLTNVCSAQTKVVAAASSTLFDENVDVRRVVAEAIRDGSPERKLGAIADMAKALESEKDSQTRLTLLEAIHTLGPKAEPALTSLLDSLKEKKVGPRPEEQHQDYRIGVILAQIGEPAAPGLAALLGNSDSHVRAASVMALGRMKHQDPEVIKQIIGMLDDKNDLVRDESSLALANIGTAAAPHIAEKFTDASKQVQVGMLKAIAKWESLPENIQSIVAKSVESSDAEILTVALGAASRCNLPADKLQQLYVSGIGNADAGVRFAVINAVRQQPDFVAALKPTLIPLLSSSDAGVVRDSAILLTTLGTDTISDLLMALKTENSQIDALGEALARLGPSITAQVIAAMKDDNPRVRAGAAAALGQIVPTRKESIEALSIALADTNEAVQTHSLQAVQQLGPRAKTALESVRALLKDSSPAIRQKSSDALFQISPRNEALVNDLTPLTGDAEDAVQVHTIQLLQTLGPLSRSAIPAVKNCLENEPSEVRLAAATFMGIHGTRAVDALPSLQTMLTDPSSELRLAAITSLTQMRASAKPVFNDIVVCLSDPESNVRGAALGAIAQIESDFKVIEPHLTTALKSEDATLHGEGLRVFGRLGREASPLLPLVIPLAKSKEMKNRVDRALRPLRRSGPDASSIPQLIELSRSSEQNVALLAIEFLGLASNNASEVMPALESLQSAESAEIKKAAADSIAKLQPKS